MSQSDYIKHKKISNELKTLSDYPSILNANDYILFKQYSLENTIVNSKNEYNKLALPNKRKIFDIERNVTSCPNFSICSSTDSRSNRKPMMNIQYQPIPVKLFAKNTFTYAKVPEKNSFICKRNNCISFNKGNTQLFCKCANI